MRVAVAALILVAASVAAAEHWTPSVVALDPDPGVDARFLTLDLEADLGLVPRDLRIRYLPPIHAADRRPRAYGGRSSGRLFIPRGNGPYGLVFDPYLAGYHARRLDFPTGFFARSYHGQEMFNRPWRLLVVDRDRFDPRDLGWEGEMRRTENLKAVADAELRAGRPVRAALAFWTQVLREPGDAPARLGLSDALLLLENYDFAGEMAREGLRAGPRWLEADLDKRGFLDDPAPLEAAIEKLRQHVARLPGAPAAQFLLGYELLFTGRAGEAVPHLAAAAGAWPEDPLPRRALEVARARAAAAGTR